MPAQQRLRLDDDYGIQHRREEPGQPDQDQAIDVSQSGARFGALRLRTNSCWRKTRISASREPRAASTDSSARKTRVSNPNIARSSITLAELRHADDVLTRHNSAVLPDTPDSLWSALHVLQSKVCPVRSNSIPHSECDFACAVL